MSVIIRTLYIMLHQTAFPSSLKPKKEASNVSWYMCVTFIG